MGMKTIKLAEATKKALDKLRHPGQSYDGAIQELMQKVKQYNADSR
jgi:hypothetical protein